jgi:ubiquitin C-terminal hydrolase
MANNQMNYPNMYQPQMANNQMNYPNMYQNNNAYQNLSLMNANSANFTNNLNFNQNNELNMIKAKSSNFGNNNNINENMEIKDKPNINNSNDSQPNTQSNQNNMAIVQQTQNVEEKDTKKNDKKDEKDIKIDKKKDKAKNDKEKKNKGQAEPHKPLIPKSQTNAMKPKIKLDFMVKSRGLVNVGATCYMNSTLQCFYHIKDLSEAIINDDSINELLEFTNCYKNLIEELAGCKDRKKFNEIQKDYDVTYDDGINSIKPTKFKEILSAKNPLFKGVRAGDAKDLIMYLLQEMDKEITFLKNNIKEIPNFKGENISEMEKENFKKIHNSPFSDLFYGFQKITNTCTKCNKIDEGYNILNILPLPLEKLFNSLNQKNLEEINMMSNNQIKPSDVTINMTRKLKLETCFRENQKEELLNGPNQMYCNGCNTSCDMKQKMEIYRAPKVLILILDRGRDNAFECDVNIPYKLDISDYVIDKENSPKKFDLKGIISHFGESSIEGHFTAFCKHFDDTWRQYNDAIVRNINDEDIFQGTPYILFYQQDIEAK